MITIAASQIDFYERKVCRLQTDLTMLQQQLVKTKSKLTFCEDYQLKYQILLEKLKDEKQNKKSYRGEQLIKKMDENNCKWQQKYDLMQARLHNQINDLNKQNQQLQRQIQITQRSKSKSSRQKPLSQGLEEDYQLLTLKYKTLLEEKQNICSKLADQKQRYEQKIKQKQEYEKKFYRDQIQTLKNKIQELQALIEEERSKVNPTPQEQIKKLKRQNMTKIEQNSKEINLLQSIIENSNQEVNKLKRQIKSLQNLYQSERKQQNQYIKRIESELFQKEKQFQMDLAAMQQSMSKIRQQQVSSLQNSIQSLQNNFENERIQWKQLIAENDEEVQRIKKLWEEDKKRYIEEKNKLKNKISELKQRSKNKEEQFPEEVSGQTQNLIKSLKNIDEKDEHFTNYENGITFLDRQLKKATIKIQEKKSLDRKTDLIIKFNKGQASQQIEQIRQNSKQQIKHLNNKILNLEQQIATEAQNSRSSKKQLKKKENQLNFERQKIQKQNDSLKKMVEEMQKDFERTLKNKNNIQVQYRQERDSVIVGKVDINQERKKKWVQLERQRSQLEIIYKQRQLRMKNDHQVKIEIMRKENDQLNQQNSVFKKDTQLMKQKLSQLGYDNKENKHSSYQKKIATLDLQIALTQNLFNCLHNASSRKNEKKKYTKIYIQNIILICKLA